VLRRRNRAGKSAVLMETITGDTKIIMPVEHCFVLQRRCRAHQICSGPRLIHAPTANTAGDGMGAKQQQSRLHRILPAIWGAGRAIPAAWRKLIYSLIWQSVMWRPGKLRFLIGVKNPLVIDRPRPPENTAPYGASPIARFATPVGLRPPFVAHPATLPHPDRRALLILFAAQHSSGESANFRFLSGGGDSPDRLDDLAQPRGDALGPESRQRTPKRRRRLARQLGVCQPGGHHGCLRDGVEPVCQQPPSGPLALRGRLGFGFAPSVGMPVIEARPG
jgi:hypothetical protein